MASTDFRVKNGLTVDTTAVISSTTDATSSSVGGALTVAGGAAVAKKLYVGTNTSTATLTATSTTDATDTATGGTLTVSGGAAIAKKLFVGGNQTITTASVPTIILNSTSSPSIKSKLQFANSGTNKWEINVDHNANGSNFLFFVDSTGPSIRMIIDSSGQVAIGVTPANAGQSFKVNKDVTGSATSYGIMSNGSIQSDVTTNFTNFYSSTPLQTATVFTVASVKHYSAAQGVLNSGSVTTQYGFSSESTGIGATTNYGFYAGDTAAVTTGKTAYGFYSAVNAASGGGTAWGIYANGTANNYFAGNVGIGTATTPSYRLHITGTSSEYRTALFETASTLGPSVQIKGSRIYELRSTDTGASEGGGLFFIYDKTAEASRVTINSSGNVIIGSGEGGATPVGNTIRGPSGSGTNIAGANLTITSGNGTGTGGSGSIYFQTALAGSTGSSANTMATRLTIASNGLVQIAAPALATTYPTISTTGTVGSITGSGPWSATITGMSSTTGLVAGSFIYATNGVGSLGGSGTYVVSGIPSGTSVTFTATGGTIPVAGSITNILTNPTTNLLELYNSNGNANYLRISQIRNSSSAADWTTATTRIQQVTDITQQAYIDFNPASGSYSLAFGTGGSTSLAERMRIDSSGNVGIGTSSPSTYGGKLSVISAASTQATVLIQNPGQGSAHLGFAASGSNFKLYNCYATGLLSGGSGIDIDSSGNVGIGRTPTYKLDVVAGTSVGSNPVLAIAPLDGALGRNSTLLFGATFSNGWGGADYVARYSGAISYGASGGGAGARDWSMRFLTGGEVAGDTPTERMRIDQGGNVGIGTTSPGALLNVKLGTNADSTGQPGGTWASIIYNATNTTAYNGLLVKNNWRAAASTIFEVGSDYVGGAYNSFLKVDGLGYVTISNTLNLANSLYIGGKLNYYGGTDGTATNGQNRLAAAVYTTGNMLYRDPTFKNGTNGIIVYDNNGTGQNTIVQFSSSGLNAPNNSGYVLKVVHAGSGQTPGYGGFTFQTQSRANATLACVFKAKIASGYTFSYTANSQGTGSTGYWATDNTGTGKWEDYVYVQRCGDSGTFSTGMYFYITGSPTPSAGSPLTWYISSATVYDLDEERTRPVSFTTSATAPVTPTVGDFWYKSGSDILYQYAYDGTSNFWLSLNTYPSSYANLGVTSTLTVSGTVSSSLIPTGNNVYNLGSSSAYWGTVYGKATSAQYADLAERYTADDNYEPGTVLEFGGTNEVTISNTDMSRKIAGIVSSNPGYLMNAELKSEFVVSLALTGRVPCKVQGTVRKGDMMVSASNGYARAEDDPRLGSVIGKALEDFDGDTGIIEVVVGRL
jgi:hypothetical protein